jgi:hypothetical protein
MLNEEDYVGGLQDEVEEGAQDGKHERHAHAPDAPGPRLRPPPTPPGIHISKIGYR